MAATSLTPTCSAILVAAGSSRRMGFDKLASPLAGYLYERDPFLVYPISIGLIALSVIISIIFAPHPITSLTTEN